MSAFELWQPAGVALAIGLLVGAERERSKGSTGSAGIRTFALVALLGNVAALLPLPLACVLLAAVAVLVGIQYAADHPADPGLTSEVALLLTLGLGVLTRSEPVLAVGAAVAMTVLLVSKHTLHHFVRDTVTDLERTDALKFFVIAFIVLPLLPDGHFGPYDVLVPQRIWFLVVLISAIGWVGYAATRALGPGRGLLVAGLAGGFVSGTATIGALAGLTRKSGVPRLAALSGVATASAATLTQIGVLTWIADHRVALRLLPALALGLAILGAEALLLSRRASATGQQSFGRPFSLVPAVVLAAVISAVLLLATWMNHELGASGAMLAAATGSLADTHASAVAVATLAAQGELPVGSAVLAVGLGLLTNTGSKVAAALATGGGRFAGMVVLVHLPPAAAMAACLTVLR